MSVLDERKFLNKLQTFSGRRNSSAYLRKHNCKLSLKCNFSRFFFCLLLFERKTFPFRAFRRKLSLKGHQVFSLTLYAYMPFAQIFQQTKLRLNIQQYLKSDIQSVATKRVRQTGWLLMIHCVSIYSPICRDMHLNNIWRSRSNAFGRNFSSNDLQRKYLNELIKTQDGRIASYEYFFLFWAKIRRPAYWTNKQIATHNTKQLLGFSHLNIFVIFIKITFICLFRFHRRYCKDPRSERLFCIDCGDREPKNIQEPRLAEPLTSFTKDFFINSVVEFIIFQYWFVTYMCTYVCAVWSSFFHHCCNLMIQNWCDQDISLTSPPPFSRNNGISM